jgi:ABC-type multidrug transport system fused ATPase/permease subunit
MTGRVVAVERLAVFSNLPAEGGPAVDVESLAPDWPTAGRLEFKNVALQYRPALPPALKGVNLAIEPGQRIGWPQLPFLLATLLDQRSLRPVLKYECVPGVCGRTGAGKSSLLMAVVSCGLAVTTQPQAY